MVQDALKLHRRYMVHDLVAEKMKECSTISNAFTMLESIAFGLYFERVQTLLAKINDRIFPAENIAIAKICYNNNC